MEEFEVRISDLPGANPLSGIELVPMVQNGVTTTRSVQDIVSEGGLQAHLDNSDPHPEYAFRVKNNLDATTNPTVNDDVNAGYTPTSRWVNTATEEFFICVTNTAGNANWQTLTLTLDELGSAAMSDVGTSPSELPTNATTDSKYLQKADNLASVTNAQTSFDNIKQSATETYEGVVEAATTSEARAATAGKYPDAQKVHQAFNKYGLGTNSPDILSSLVEVDAQIVTGVYSVSNVLVVSGEDPYGHLIVYSNAPTRTTQTYRPLLSTTSEFKEFHRFSLDGGATWSDWVKIYHTGNDGAGSGMDADLLDGEQGTYYLDFNNFTNLPDPQLTLNGDVSGSVTFTNLGNATLTVTVADDSHNHVISNVDGLQTALNNKLDATATAVNSELLDNLDSTQFLRSDQSDTMIGNLTVDGTVNADLFDGSGANLTNLNASALSSGTVPDARLPATISSDITGNAATATMVKDWGNYGAPFDDPTNTDDTFSAVGLTHVFVRSTDGWPISFGKLLNVPGFTSNGAGCLQLLTPYTPSYTTLGNPIFRSSIYNTTSWTDWKEMLDLDSADSRYLRKDTSDTMSGDLFLGGNSIIRHSGDSDTYMQFHNNGRWRVVTDNAERLEVTNATTNVRNNLNVDGVISGDGSGLTNLPVAAGVPSGVITMWSGSIASIPSGWVLCDGNNGTPNLTNRFVVGAGGTYGVDSIGGSADAVLIEHSHTGTAVAAGGHSHSGYTYYDGDHQHIQGEAQGSAYSSSYYPYGRITSTTRSGFTWGNYDNTAYEIYTNSTGSHRHYFVTSTVNNHSHSLTINTTGTHADGVDKNLPPYYALAYIMKT